MVAEHMKEELAAMREAGRSNTLYDEAVAYVATMCTSLMDAHSFKPAEWDACFTPYIGPYVGERTAEACQCAAAPWLACTAPALITPSSENLASAARESRLCS